MKWQISARSVRGCQMRWIELNKDVLIAYWDGIIEYTEDAIAAIRPIG